jgi:cell division protein FtsL
VFRFRPFIRRRRRDGDVPPLEPGVRTARLRRGGPRTPIPLLPIIAVAAGIGVAYVSQAAGATKTSYEVTSLQSQEQRLENQDQQLGNELAQLESSERIVAAAQAIGMQPSSTWSAVAASPVRILPTAAPQQAAQPDQGGALQQLIGALSGSAPSTRTQP